MVDKHFFADKNVLIMGLGRFRGGLDSAAFASGAAANVTVTDLLPADNLADSISALADYPDITFHLGSHKTEDFENADIVIVNPAVPFDNPFLDIARKNNAMVTTQINIFLQLCPATVIGITGSNGKSTTAALAAHILAAAMKKENCKYTNVTLSGNIGNKPLLQTLDKLDKDSLVVLELSSFQTEWLADIKISPRIALLTNLTPNHLDRHKSFQSYCDAKENIFRYQSTNSALDPVSIFAADDHIASKWFDKYSREDNRTCIKFLPADICDSIKSQFNLLGKVNLANLAAARAIANHFGVTDSLIADCVADFQPLPHRLQLIADRKGIKWYNDSKSTTPQSAIVALDSFDSSPIIIAGGYDKKIPFDSLSQAIAQKAKAAILIGQTAKIIADSIPTNNHIEIVLADSLADAVNAASRIASAGDAVILSPGCASYDMFENYQQRGNSFTKLVKKLYN